MTCLPCSSAFFRAVAFAACSNSPPSGCPGNLRLRVTPAVVLQYRLASHVVSLDPRYPRVQLLTGLFNCVVPETDGNHSLAIRRREVQRAGSEVLSHLLLLKLQNFNNNLVQACGHLRH